MTATISLSVARSGASTRPRRAISATTAPTWRAATSGSSDLAGQNSRGWNSTIVSIMSSGAGSVGVSARPSLPVTIATSGNRQRTMSRAFRSSIPWAIDIRGTEIGMSITIPSSSGVRNSRPSGTTFASATRPARTSVAIPNALPLAPVAVSPTARSPPAIEPRKRAREPTAAEATRNVAARSQSSGAGRSIR